MNREEIASLALKLMGVYAWLEALTYLGYWGTVITTSEHPSLWVSLFPSALLMAGAGAILIFRSERLARRLLPAPPSEPSAPPTALSALEIQIISFSIVGLALVVFNLPEAGRYISTYLMSGHYPGVDLHLRETDIPRIVSLALKLLLGLALFFRPAALAAWWKRKQPGSRPHFSN